MIKQQFSSPPPVKVGDVIECKCEALGSQGDGVFKIDKFIVFARGAMIDEYYKLRIVKVLEKVGFAEIIEN